ncbi:MAG: DNA recombination protein RmuC [Limisphaerales bacterium]
MTLTIQLAIVFIIGGGLGLCIGWLLGSRKQPVSPSDARLENELRQQVTQRESEISQTREQLSQAKTSLATALANEDAAKKILSDQKSLYEQNLRDAKVVQEKALADLRDTFKALSADALKQSAPEFLRLAEQSFGKFQETAKGDLAQRQEAIKGLVEPLKQQLETYQKNLQQSSVAQSGALGEVKKHLETLTQSNVTLAQETQQFRLVLHSNQARGKWGAKRNVATRGPRRRA